MKIKPITIRRSIIYPAIITTGLLCSCDRTETPKVPEGQPEQRLAGSPSIERPGQRLAGEVAEPRIGAKPLSDPTANDKVRKVEELQKQAEKKEHETLEERGAVTPPTDSKTDTESQTADSEPHS